MYSKFAVLFVAVAAALCAQETPLDPYNSVKINLPADSPLTLISANLGESHASFRGSAVVLDLKMALTLRNSSSNRVRGVTLLVAAQEVTPGGKASVSVPSLDVPPGQNFPVRIDLRLLRPGQMGSGPLVQVNLDGVLFQDFSFYGPDRLDSRRSMIAWEMEAQRDRKYFKSILASRGLEGLKQAMTESLARQNDRPRLDVQVSRGRTVSAAAVPEHPAQFAFLRFPDAPVEPVEGWAEIAGNEARNPRIDVKNLSSRQVRYVEIGWIVTDRQGKQFMAASVPASGPEFNLKPGSKSRVLQDTALRFSKDRESVFIDKMTAFVSQVEFADGKIWIPNRESLANAQLLGILAPSAEEQRLTDLYLKKGPKALADELSKF
ncbi:MAG: hypothetical protein ABSH32_25550 [Bryobacteraceae bacterium]|jgi:hypothetical protein